MYRNHASHQVKVLAIAGILLLGGCRTSRSSVSSHAVADRAGSFCSDVASGDTLRAVEAVGRTGSDTVCADGVQTGRIVLTRDSAGAVSEVAWTVRARSRSATRSSVREERVRIEERASALSAVSRARENVSQESAQKASETESPGGAARAAAAVLGLLVALMLVWMLFEDRWPWRRK